MVESKKVSSVNHEAPEFLESDYDANNLSKVENMSLDETKEKMEWQKSALEYKNSYVIEKWDKLIHIHDNEVNSIAECNLLHDIINPPKRAKNINSHYSHILHGCMNNRKESAKFKNFQILLYRGCSSTIVMRKLVEKYTLRQLWGTRIFGKWLRCKQPV